MISEHEPILVSEVRARWDAGDDTARIAKKLMVSEATVSKIVSAYVSEKARARREAAE